MASLNLTDPTMLDIVRRQDPDGTIANIVEVLSKKNPILEHAVVKEGNLQTGHRFTTRNTEPALGWRRFNDGIVPSKSTTTQYDESCGMLEGFSYVDAGLAKLNGNEAAFRYSEDRAFMSALNKEAVRALIYASVSDNPEEIHGLSPRYAALATPNVVNGATYTGTTAAGNEQSSIWFVCWGEDTTYLIYPKGMLAGIQMEDLNKQIVDAGSSKKYTAWVTHWMWNLGLCVQDRRQIARVCNLDTTDINTVAEMALIVDAMIAAYYKIYDPSVGRLNIYTNRTIGEMLHRGAMTKASSQLTLGTYAGKPITEFLGYPVHILDGMLATEAPLV
jgi:hypothetical protein